MNHDIYVFIEQRAGKTQKVSLELLCEARRLAAELAGRVVAVLPCAAAEGAEALFGYGAEEVILVEDELLALYATEPYTKALCSVIEQYRPYILLFGATAIGRDLAPRVAARIHTGLTADCTGLAIDPETKLLRMTRPAFGGNIMATIICQNYRPQMATVRPGVMELAAPETGRSGTLTRHAVAFAPADMNIEILAVHPDEAKSVDITAARLVVSGGRGVGGPEGYAPLAALAAELGGEVGASRVGVDSGWIEKPRQVGQTGKTVRPTVYIACGISGAIQHLAGMEASDYIIAINKDPDAPIMAAADLAIVGDLRQIVPRLTQALKARRG